ncbi:MAG: C4-dicarboxylate ABC transporter permease [Rhodobiaceae bacterium]|nr:C4-dicarboxylate ABC transporter permease [Rhodobiaceae bacterium]RPF97523.1 MAG: TRAP transporter large permease [Rhizobiales bacterium TMED227]
MKVGLTMLEFELILVGLLLFFVAIGVHIVIALGVTAVLGVYFAYGDFGMVQKLVGSTSYEGLRNYVFAVIPLFMLMGEFISKSGTITDVYRGIQRGLKKLPGRLALATVMGNAIFSFVTGVSIASAAAFTRIAYPEMKRHRYNNGFSLASITGSSVLGMLIPPSVLMIVWGILTERSIGQIFLAGVIPGLLLTGLFIVYILCAALIMPKLVGLNKDGTPIASTEEVEEENLETQGSVLWSSIWLFGIIATVLGGIWVGFFSPTEGAGVGAALGLILAISKGATAKDIIGTILSVGRTSAPILLLLLTASLYSRSLAMTGVTSTIQDLFLSTGFGYVGIVLLMMLIWFILGMIIDSISIMLLTVAIFEPIAVSLGIEPMAFAILGIIAIEAGLLTPPFGLLVYTVKASARDKNVRLGQIFYYSIPYWIIMLITVMLLLLFPGIATFLPNLLF